MGQAFVASGIVTTNSWVHGTDMTVTATNLQSGLVASFYAEALLLADEARAWFDRAMGNGGASPHRNLADANRLDDPLWHWAGRHDPSLRIALSCESLRLTTRLMHIIAWLLLQRAITTGELPFAGDDQEADRLGPSPTVDRAVLERLPEDAQRLISSSVSLYDRVALLERTVRGEMNPQPTPVAQMLARLQASL